MFYGRTQLSSKIRLLLFNKQNVCVNIAIRSVRHRESQFEMARCLVMCVFLLHVHTALSYAGSTGDNSVSSEVDRLASEIQGLQDDLDTLLTSEGQQSRAVWSLHKRSLAVNGEGCPDRFLQFQCPTSGACLSYYQVCDGYPDCPGGHDELECDLASFIREGSILNGTLIYDTCSLVDYRKYRMEVVGIKEDAIFPNMPMVALKTLATILDKDGEMYIDVVATPRWIFASRSLFIPTMLGNGVEYYFNFNLEDQNKMTEYAVRQHNGEECGRYMLDIKL